jgi:hypothetical protein
MKYSSNWYDLDPMYSDSMIYSVSDSAGQHILGFYRGQFWGEADAPAVEDLPSYNWDIDGYMGHGSAELPREWPRFDGSYTNPDILTASLEGLPLGDLNWYPEAKFQWFANREGIRSHVLDLNEARFQLRDPDSISYEAQFTIVREDQTPLMGAVLVVEGDTVGISDRYGRIDLDTLAGSYGYTCSAHAYEELHGSFTVAYASLSKTITLRYAVGIEPDPATGSGISIYPNPTGTFLYVEGDHLAGARMQVINLNGSIVAEKLLSSHKNTVDLTNEGDGLYVVRIVKDHMQFNRKITIQH